MLNLEAYRLDVPLSKRGGVFDTSQANIDLMRKFGRDYVASNPPEFVAALEALSDSESEQTTGLQ